MALRDDFTAQLKAAMIAKNAPLVLSLRSITAKLKDFDIAARPKGVDKISDDEIVAMLRGMVKSRRESVEMYRQGNREELAAKEEAEIVVIETFLPQQMDAAAMEAAVAAAIAESGATAPKEMGKVMALVKQRAAGQADMAAVSAQIKAALGG